jgi:hypothetical protein
MIGVRLVVGLIVVLAIVGLLPRRAHGRTDGRQ